MKNESRTWDVTDMRDRKASTVDTPPSTTRRIKYRLWEKAQPDFSVALPDRTLRVPAVLPAARLLPRRWPPNSRARLIAAVLAGRPGSFLDVGANVGQTLFDYLSAKVSARYVGFEPNAECLALLNAIVAANGLHDVAQVVPAGLSDKDGVLPFYVVAGSEADRGGTLIGDLRPARPVRTLIVPVYRLDAILPTLAVDPPALVKIDVEGAERETLNGMVETLRTAKPWVAIEILYRDSAADQATYEARLGDVETLLADIDYRIVAIDKSEDEAAILGLRELDRFPRSVWTQANKHECDYLLAPTDKIGEIVALSAKITG